LLHERRDLDVDFFLEFTPTRLDVFGIEDDVDDAASVRERTNHFVSEIARHVGDRATSRVRCDDGLRRSIHDVPKRFVRDVRNIDHHSQPVHLAHHALAKLI